LDEIDARVRKTSISFENPLAENVPNVRVLQIYRSNQTYFLHKDTQHEESKKNQDFRQSGRGDQKM